MSKFPVILFWIFIILAACGKEAIVSEFKGGTLTVVCVPNTSWRQVSDYISLTLIRFPSASEVVVNAGASGYSVHFLVPPASQRVITESRHVTWDVGIPGFDRYSGYASPYFNEAHGLFYTVVQPGNSDSGRLLITGDGSVDADISDFLSGSTPRSTRVIVVNFVAEPTMTVAEVATYVEHIYASGVDHVLISCGYVNNVWPPLDLPNHWMNADWD